MLLRHIRYLLAVAEHGNFTRAAQALHVSQPALSQQIKQLEDTLGVTLFDRSGRGVTSTDAGRVYLEHARRSLRELEAGQRALQEVADLSRGQLRLAVTPTFSEYLVAPLLERFGARYPGVVIHFQEMSLDQLTLALGEDALDLGIGFSSARSSEIDCQALFDERLRVVVSSDPALWSALKPLSLADLKRLPLALLTRDFATRNLIDGYCQTHKFTPNIRLEANSISTLIKVVRYGRMATILPDAIVAEYPSLRCLAMRPALPGRTVALLSRKGAYRSAAAGAFAQLLEEHAQGYQAAQAPTVRP